jgi:hypothetical protein
MVYGDQGGAVRYLVGVSAAYVYTLLRLPWPAPDITTAIVNGRQPPQRTAKQLMRLTVRLPTDWAEQRMCCSAFVESKSSVL